MTNNAAVLEDFTIEIHLTSDKGDLFLLVNPEDDLSDEFRAWDKGAQEFITVEPWDFHSGQYQVRGTVFSVIEQVED